MATTRFGVNAPETVKLWSKKLAEEALATTELQPLIGEGPNSIIVEKTDTKKASGDRVTYTLMMNLEGDGVTEGQVQEGNEESLETFTADLVINELGHAIDIPGSQTIDSQRVPFNLRNAGKERLKRWFAKRFSVVAFNHLCGNTVETRAVYRGNNAIVAPSSGRIIRAGSQANDESLTSSDTFDLRLIDYAREVAMTATPQIQPVMVDGQEMYVVYISPQQETDLTTNTSTGQWLSIQQAAMQGGKVSNNPIFTGALGVYKGCVIRRAYDLPAGVHSSSNTAVSSTKRAVLLGAQSGAIGFGQGMDDTTSFKWVEVLKDYERQLGISARTIYGFQKTQFNSVDFGTVVISTYAAAHS